MRVLINKIITVLGKDLNSKFDKSNITPSPQIKIDYQAGFRITQKWLSKRSGFHIVFALLFNIVIGLGTHVFLQQKIYEQNPVFLAFAIFPLAGVVLAYRGLGEILNITTIQIKSGRLISSTRPISISGPIVINTMDINNILVSRRQEGENGNKNIYSYLLIAHLKNGKEKVILRAKDLNEALYVEKLIEDQLSIVDNPELDRRMG